MPEMLGWAALADKKIAEVLRELPKEADLATARKAISKVYPFGERRHHPYRVWCKQVSAALTLRYPELREKARQKQNAKIAKLLREKYPHLADHPQLEV